MTNQTKEIDLAIKNIVLPIENLEKMQLQEEPNLLDNASYKDGFYIAGQNEEVPFASFKYTTNYIAVLPGKTYIKSRGAQLSGIFYDETKTVITDIVTGNGEINSQFTTPAAAKYIRVNVSELDTSPSIRKVGEKSQFSPDYIPKLPADKIHGLEDVNILKGVALKKGYFLGDANVEYEILNFSYTDFFIPIAPSTTYKKSVGLNTVGMQYDANKEFISKITATAGEIDSEFTTHHNAAYVKINISNEEASPYVALSRPQCLVPSINPKRITIDSRNVNSFIGAMNFVLDQLLAAKPRARFAIVTHFSEDSATITRRFSRLIEIQKALGEYWHCPLANIIGKSTFINRSGNNTIAANMADGIHPASDPTMESVDVMAEIIIDFLKGIRSDWNGKKIAWYGTSIPAGFPYQNNQKVYSYANRAVTALGGTIINNSVPNGRIRATGYDGEPSGFEDLSFTQLTAPVNYKNSMIDLIGTDNEPDLFVFDYGVNDESQDSTDFELFDPANPF